MNEHVLKIKKEDVYNEVAKTTSYTGAKMEDDAAYERIFTTAEDKTMLERFTYTLTLELSASFDDSLLESMERSLFSFFVMNITAKWYTFTNKNEATDYAAGAATNLEDIMRKAFFKKKPRRPTYN